VRYFIVLFVFVSGCATYRPIIDIQGVDEVKYSNDVVECTNYARLVDPAGNAASNAAAGAAIGAVIGAIFCGRNCAAQVAAGTAVYGAAHGAGAAAEVQRDIVRRCLTGRGYTVLY
jgi:hypothetical protein